MLIGSNGKLSKADRKVTDKSIGKNSNCGLFINRCSCKTCIQDENMKTGNNFMKPCSVILVRLNLLGHDGEKPSNNYSDIHEHQKQIFSSELKSENAHKKFRFSMIDEKKGMDSNPNLYGAPNNILPKSLCKVCELLLSKEEKSTSFKISNRMIHSSNNSAFNFRIKNKLKKTNYSLGDKQNSNIEKCRGSKPCYIHINSKFSRISENIDPEKNLFDPEETVRKESFPVNNMENEMLSTREESNIMTYSPSLNGVQSFDNNASNLLNSAKCSKPVLKNNEINTSLLLPEMKCFENSGLNDVQSTPNLVVSQIDSSIFSLPKHEKKTTRKFTSSSNVAEVQVVESKQKFATTIFKDKLKDNQGGIAIAIRDSRFDKRSSRSGKKNEDLLKNALLKCQLKENKSKENFAINKSTLTKNVKFHSAKNNHMDIFKKMVQPCSVSLPRINLQALYFSDNTNTSPSKKYDEINSDGTLPIKNSIYPCGSKILVNKIYLCNNTDGTTEYPLSKWSLNEQKKKYDEKEVTQSDINFEPEYANLNDYASLSKETYKNNCNMTKLETTKSTSNETAINFHKEKNRKYKSQLYKKCISSDFPTNKAKVDLKITEKPILNDLFQRMKNNKYVQSCKTLVDEENEPLIFKSSTKMIFKPDQVAKVDKVSKNLCSKNKLPFKISEVLPLLKPCYVLLYPLPLHNYLKTTLQKSSGLKCNSIKTQISGRKKEDVYLAEEIPYHSNAENQSSNVQRMMNDEENDVSDSVCLEEFNEELSHHTELNLMLKNHSKVEHDVEVGENRKTKVDNDRKCIKDSSKQPVPQKTNKKFIFKSSQMLPECFENNPGNLDSCYVVLERIKLDKYNVKNMDLLDEQQTIKKLKTPNRNKPALNDTEKYVNHKIKHNFKSVKNKRNLENILRKRTCVTDQSDMKNITKKVYRSYFKGHSISSPHRKIVKTKSKFRKSERKHFRPIPKAITQSQTYAAGKFSKYRFRNARIGSNILKRQMGKSTVNDKSLNLKVDSLHPWKRKRSLNTKDASRTGVKSTKVEAFYNRKELLGTHEHCKSDSVCISDYLCVQCNNPVSSDIELYHHTCAGKRKKGYLCDICEKIYKTKAALKLHVKSHLYYSNC